MCCKYFNLKDFVDAGSINKARQNRKQGQSRNSGLMN